MAKMHYVFLPLILLLPFSGILADDEPKAAEKTGQESKTDFIKGMKEPEAFEALNDYIAKGNVERVTLILDVFPDLLKKKDKFERTPLFNACYAGNIECVKLFLAKGADLKTPGPGGDLPLHRATESGHLEIVKLLLDKGAIRWAQNQKGEIALFKAVAFGHKDVVDYLIKKGDFINTVDKSNNTPLHKAAQHNSLEMVKYLVDKGAIVKAKNKAGKKAADLTAKKEIKDYLNERDPEVPADENKESEEK